MKFGFVYLFVAMFIFAHGNNDMSIMSQLTFQVMNCNE